MEIRLDGLDTKRVTINQNGSIYGLKKYAGYEAMVVILEQKEAK